MKLEIFIFSFDVRCITIVINSYAYVVLYEQQIVQQIYHLIVARCNKLLIIRALLNTLSDTNKRWKPNTKMNQIPSFLPGKFRIGRHNIHSMVAPLYGLRFILTSKTGEIDRKTKFVFQFGQFWQQNLA